MITDTQTSLSETDIRFANKAAVHGVALMVLERVAAGMTGKELIAFAILAPFFGFLTLLIYRQAARTLAVVLASLSAIFALLFAVTAILHPVQVRSDMDVLTLMFVLLVILPGILALLLFTKRITLGSMRLRTPVTAEQQSKRVRYQLRVIPVLVVWLCYGVYRAIQSGASTAPLRLFAILAMTLILGFDVLSGLRKNLNSAH